MGLHLPKIDRRAALARRTVLAVLGCRRLAHLVRARMVDPIGRWLDRRAGAQAMIQLDDHLLRDIGLSRSEVQAAAYGIVAPGAAAGENPAGGRVPACGARWLALAAAGLALAGAAWSAAANDFARLPSVADLPARTVKVSPPVPGMGEHWANPRDLPLGPIYCVMHGRVVCAEFMVSQKDLASGRSFERLRFGLNEKQPPINHLELNFQPHGHEGYEIPHYDLHMYFISPEARFGEQAATP